MKEPTRQDIFNTAYAGLKAQGFKQSLDGRGYCRYRGEDGCKCAVGHLIPDERYNSSFEGSGVTYTPISSAAGVEDIDDINFLREMQIAHDQNDLPQLMEAKLRTLAEKHGLMVPA